MSQRSKSIEVDGRTVTLSRPDKLLFPKSGITKADLADYYRRIAPHMLPFLQNRPLSMQRFPDGIAEEGFFQKGVSEHFPDWISRARLAKEGGTVDYVVADDAATLVYLANQAAITLHVALSRLDRIRHPDRLVFDLDPPDRNFRRICRAALLLRDFLADLGLSSFVKTTGSRGLHIEVPLDRSSDFDEARAFARRVGEKLSARYPGNLTIEQRKSKRGKRIFIDYLRNAYGQTTVAPYTVRAREGAPVATPLDWAELKKSALTARRYTVRNIFRRLAQKPDPWADFFAAPASLGEARRRLEKN